MAQERLSMRKTKEILRLKSLGLSNRQIAASTSVARSTVADYLKRAEAAKIAWPLAKNLSDDALEARLFCAPPRPTAKVEPDYRYIHKELKRKGVTLMLLWEEQLEANPGGYSYSQFCVLYRRWKKKLRPSLRQLHRAGEKLFVDYAGQTVPIVDASTGEVRPAQIFVAVLGASNYTFAEATGSQDLFCWTGSHVRAFNFFGGVPRAVVPDNLKSGVLKSCRYEPDLNPAYAELAAHYKTTVIPARPVSPRDKAKVESGVLIVERWILARLRNLTFFSLAELNLAIAELVTRLNEKPFQKLDGSRKSMFLELERGELLPLPETPYQFARWKKARANIDYHIEVEYHYYSVPYRLIGQQLDVRLTATVVEVFNGGVRITSHIRSYKKGGFTTKEEHRPKAHRRYMDWKPSRIIAWAEKTGPATRKLTEAILAKRTHPEHGYRSCLGLLRLGERYSPQRLEAAAARALRTGAHSYKSVKSILEKGLDQLPEEEDAPQLPLIDHGNLRGSGYYNQKEKLCL